MHAITPSECEAIDNTSVYIIYSEARCRNGKSEQTKMGQRNN